LAKKNERHSRSTKFEIDMNSQLTFLDMSSPKKYLGTRRKQKCSQCSGIALRCLRFQRLCLGPKELALLCDDCYPSFLSGIMGKCQCDYCGNVIYKDPHITTCIIVRLPTKAVVLTCSKKCEKRNRKEMVAESASYVCENCGKKESTMSRCSKCGIARYCSRECQVKNWPEHKRKCVKSSRS
jgi:hypothetical protein